MNDGGGLFEVRWGCVEGGQGKLGCMSLCMNVI